MANQLNDDWFHLGCGIYEEVWNTELEDRGVKEHNQTVQTQEGFMERWADFDLYLARHSGSKYSKIKRRLETSQEKE